MKITSERLRIAAHADWTLNWGVAAHVHNRNGKNLRILTIKGSKWQFMKVGARRRLGETLVLTHSRESVGTKNVEADLRVPFAHSSSLHLLLPRETLRSTRPRFAR